MAFSVFGLLAMGNWPTEYIAIAHCRHSFQNMPFAWTGTSSDGRFPANLGCWRESCRQRAGWSRAHAHWQITTRAGVEPPPKRSMIIFGATMPKLMARIIAIAVMASAMVARRRSKFAFE